MYRKLRHFILISSLLFITSGCIHPLYISQQTIYGNGDIITEERSVGNFSSLRITGSRATVLYGDQYGPIRITGDSNIVNFTRSYIDGDQLVITSEPNTNLRPTQRVYVEVPGMYVHQIRVSGSNEITLNNIDKNYLQIRGSGSTQVIANGYADELEIRMSGSSRIDAADLISDVISIRTSGSSRATVHVLESLEAHSSGSSQIRFRGRPQIVDSRSSGASRLQSVHQ